MFTLFLTGFFLQTSFFLIMSDLILNEGSNFTVRRSQKEHSSVLFGRKLRPQGLMTFSMEWLCLYMGYSRNMETPEYQISITHFVWASYLETPGDCTNDPNCLFLRGKICYDACSPTPR